MNFPDLLFFYLQDNLINEILTTDLFMSVPVNDIGWCNWTGSRVWNYPLHTSVTNNIRLEFFTTQSEHLSLYNNIENLISLYHYSIPNTKLNYPEPFVASASSMHSDLWFVHILIYQYWVWFVFSFIIIFFFLTFICIVRWCNMRVRPRRETRGVSRSKCGDLITACVPVSWATSIIINESTDAIDYYDGFGTTELVIGIRAYQWGWEYYYPKDLDLNYNIHKNYSIFLGNSLKYNFNSDLNLKTNNLWKFYQNKQTDYIITPAHLLWFCSDNYQLINFINFADVGVNTLFEINAFKKTHLFSKINNFHSLPTTVGRHSVFNFIGNKFVSTPQLFFALGYGLKRQHNLASSQLSVNNQTPFNFNSSSKIIQFNWQFLHQRRENLLDSTSSAFFNKNFYNQTGVFQRLWLELLHKCLLNNHLLSISFFTTNQDSFLLFNNDTDKKNLNNLLLPSRSVLLKKNFFRNKNYTNYLNFHNYQSISPIETYSKLSNIIKTYNVFSANQTILTNSKFIRRYLTIQPQNNHLNISTTLNSLVSYYKSFFSSSCTPQLLFNLSKTDFPNPETALKLITNKIFFDYPHSPIVSNSALFRSIEFDSLSNSLIEEVPTIFQGKEDNLPDYLTTSYWNFFWLAFPSSTRIANILFFNTSFAAAYLPFFSFYYDYDFRNWQNFELFEDNFWEIYSPISSFDEYQNLFNEFYSFATPTKLIKFFNILDRVSTLRNIITNQPSSIGEEFAKITNSFFIDLEDTTNLQTTSLESSYLFSVLGNILNVDESYENLKTTLFLLNTTQNIQFGIAGSSNRSLPSNSIFNSFRPDFDDFSWYVNESSFNDKNDDWEIPNWSNSYRFNSTYQLRNTVKSSIVNYNALQKVFHTRFDEGRSHSKLDDLALTNDNQPFLSSRRPKYEKLIGKNIESFFKINYYNPYYQQCFNPNVLNFTALNYYFFDFPFLLAYKSDASRYLWFDWFAKWGLIDIQPASASKYALHGMPFYNKYFDFNSNQNELFNETESYFIRLNRARKNYLLNWSHSPFLFAKNIVWTGSNLLDEFISNNVHPISQLNFLTNTFNWYWTSVNNNYHYHFLPSISNTTSFAKNNAKPITSINSYYYSLTHLADIFTKREWLYRQFLSNSRLLINLPSDFAATPKNILFDEIKSAFEFSDFITLNNEYSKEIFFNSLQYFNYWFQNKFLNTDYHTNFFKFYVNKTFNSFSPNGSLIKNQFRPMRKGIGNMIRLHASGAIAMPIEIRLQVLASSKDVIHSWAVPSAGIKIDCIPGYSSHKVMIFLVSGIFWGQCMEICGRYHHWMPIIVYFMKRDLFFLWCSHFVFLSGANNVWTINDRQFVNYTQPVSYSKTNWVQELIK